MVTLTPTPAANAAVKAAQDVPQLIAGLNQINPGWVQQLLGKSLISTTSTPVTVVAAIIGWAVPHYGLACGAVATAGCWSADTVNTVSTLGGLLVGAIASYVMRYRAKAPVSGILTPAPLP